MTEAVTPAAATPATPAATPEATPPAAAATPAPAATPAAEPAKSAPPASLLPEASAVTAEPAAPSAPATPAPAVNQDAPEWFLADGVKGTGQAPEWYKADKYKTVQAQAEAYASLEKRFGAFTGAPKDGKYEFKMPEGVTGELEADHPLLKKFGDWAKENQLSNDGYNAVLGMLAEYEAGLAPDIGAIRESLGKDGADRINAIAAWAKANIPGEYDLFREATSGANAAAVFKLAETLIGKSKQIALPKPGEDVVGSIPGGEAAINAAQGKLGPDGRRLYETDPVYRAKVEKMRMDYYNSRKAA